MKRIFHPIGQGAFYSESFDNFNIVYDCGNWRNTKSSDDVIKKSFESGSEIDILFISHFDYDHISKIDILKKFFKIKRVIFPLLYDNEKKLVLSQFEWVNNPSRSSLPVIR